MIIIYILLRVGDVLLYLLLCPQTAFSVLQNHPQVIRERIAIVGLSFGASMALGLSVYSPTIKVDVLFITLIYTLLFYFFSCLDHFL